MTRRTYRLGLLILAAAALAVAAVVAAHGQGRIPGVGLPGVPHPDFQSEWCAQVRPPADWPLPGACGLSAPTDPAVFDCARVCPANGWQGAFAEFFPRAQLLLRTCWELDFWGTRATHDGRYTSAEFEWAQVSGDAGKTSAAMRTCWFEAHEQGGSETRPIVLTDENARSYRNHIAALQRLGLWQAGLFSASLYNPTTGGLDLFGEQRRTYWPVWFENRTSTSGLPTPTPPAPTPTPQPTPEPTATPQPTPVTPTCSTLTVPPDVLSTAREAGAWDKRLSARRRAALRRLSGWWTSSPLSTGRLDYCVTAP